MPSTGRHESSRLAKWWEALVGAGLALVVYVLPYLVDLLAESRDFLADSFLSDKKLASAISFALLFTGILFTVNRQQITSRIDSRLEELRRISAYLDLSRQVQYSALSEIAEMYSRIANPHFNGVKHELIADLRVALSSMSSQGESPSLPASVYAQGEHAALKAAVGTRTRVRALATLFVGDFDLAPTAEELLYIDANLQVVRAGGDFERLFVIESARYADALARPTVLLHSGEAPKIPGRVVFRETLREVDATLEGNIGDGYLLFSDDVAFVDAPSDDRRTRGKIVVDPVKLGQYERLYDRLRAYSYSITTDLHPMTGDVIARPNGGT